MIRETSLNECSNCKKTKAWRNLRSAVRVDNKEVYLCKDCIKEEKKTIKIDYTEVMNRKHLRDIIGS